MSLNKLRWRDTEIISNKHALRFYMKKSSKHVI